MNYQKTTIIGRFTRDHEMRHTPKGTAVLQNSVAVNRRWKDAGGQKQEAVTFYEVKIWGATAEAINNYTVKGSPILLEMRMENESWDDKQTGQKRSRCVFVVESFEFMESADSMNSRGEGRAQGAGDRDGRQATQQQSSPQGQQPADRQQNSEAYDDDDIPF